MILDGCSSSGTAGRGRDKTATAEGADLIDCTDILFEKGAFKVARSGLHCLGKQILLLESGADIFIGGLLRRIEGIWAAEFVNQPVKTVMKAAEVNNLPGLQRCNGDIAAAARCATGSAAELLWCRPVGEAIVDRTENFLLYINHESVSW
jgi:hypothetical protein